MARKQLLTPQPGPNTPHSCLPSDTNYESLFERKLNAGTPGAGGNLLMSGPPSYDSNYFSKTFEKPSHQHSNGHHGHNHNHNNHHHTTQSLHRRDHSDMSQQHRENQANRILAQYENAKGLVDIDPKASLKHSSSFKHQHTSIYCDSAADYCSKGKQEKDNEKKLIDTSPPSCNNGKQGGNNDVSQPSRFRMPLPVQQGNQRYQPSGQCASDVGNDLVSPGGNYGTMSSTASGSSSTKHCNNAAPPPPEPKKPYELLEGVYGSNNGNSGSGSHHHNHNHNHSNHHHHHHNHHQNRKLMDFSPNQHHHHHNHNNGGGGGNANNVNNYTSRLLMSDKDSTYSRILEPLMNSKPSPGVSSPNGTLCKPSPNDHLMYSYH